MTGAPQAAAGEADVGTQSLLPAFFSLFASSGTLVCCALPAMLVSVGMGATMAGLIEAVPQITWLGKHKTIVFLVAGLVIAGAGLLQWRARNQPCPIDPAKARACARARAISSVMWWISVAALAVGVFFAYFAVYVFF